MERVSRFRLIVETLNFLLRKGTFVSTSEIQRYLFSLGLVKSTAPAGGERKRLNRLLSFLEAEGYVESELPNPKEKIPMLFSYEMGHFPVV